MSFHKDLWSSGQMGSKLWLCNELEKLNLQQPQAVWVLGGWCGLMSQLILCREKIQIEMIRSFDIDPDCEILADQMNNYWEWQHWKFKAFTADCNLIDYSSSQTWSSRSPDIVINTSVEHFESLNWWERIPAGTLCALQSNNMVHDTHVANMKNLNEMRAVFQMKELIYSGEMFFDYKNPNSFTRFMLIGRK